MTVTNLKHCVFNAENHDSVWHANNLILFRRRRRVGFCHSASRRLCIMTVHFASLGIRFHHRERRGRSFITIHSRSTRVPGTAGPLLPRFYQ
eukprot:32378-Rhodomonas_salina.2